MPRGVPVEPRLAELPEVVRARERVVREREAERPRVVLDHALALMRGLDADAAAEVERRAQRVAKIRELEAEIAADLQAQKRGWPDVLAVFPCHSMGDLASTAEPGEPITPRRRPYQPDDYVAATLDPDVFETTYPFNAFPAELRERWLAVHAAAQERARLRRGERGPREMVT